MSLRCRFVPSDSAAVAMRVVAWFVRLSLGRHSGCKCVGQLADVDLQPVESQKREIATLVQWLHDVAHTERTQSDILQPSTWSVAMLWFLRGYDACVPQSLALYVRARCLAAERVFNWHYFQELRPIAAAWRLQQYRSCVVWTCRVFA